MKISVIVSIYNDGRDPRIVVLVQKNRRVSVTRNNGIEEATGQYMGFVNSDDYVTLIDFTIRRANDKTFHSKKLSCLDIYNKVKKDSFLLNNKNLYLCEKSLFLRAHFIISMLMSLSSSKKNKQQLFYQDLHNNIKA